MTWRRISVRSAAVVVGAARRPPPRRARGGVRARAALVVLFRLLRGGGGGPPPPSHLAAHQRVLWLAGVVGAGRPLHFIGGALPPLVPQLLPISPLALQ